MDIPTVPAASFSGQTGGARGVRLAEAGPGPPIPDAAGIALRPGATEDAEDCRGLHSAWFRLHFTQVEGAQRFAAAHLDERAKNWRMAEVAAGTDGSSVIEFDLRLQKSVDLAAFVREIEQGSPNVTSVELMRTKSRRHPDE